MSGVVHGAHTWASLAPPEFAASVFRQDGRAVVALSGELDLDTVDAIDVLVGEALDGGARHVVVDLRALTFIAGCAVGALLGCSRRAADASADFSLLAGDGCARRLLEVCSSLGLPDPDS